MSEKKRKSIGIVLIAIIAICVIGIIASPKKDDNETEQTGASASTPETTEQDSKAEPEDTAEQSEAETKEESTLDEMSVIFLDSVRNDVTGNWRMAKVTGSKSAEEYAADYYKEYFKAENEVHAVVNFTLKTTTCITYVGGKINVRIYEYVDGEEHDAKALFGGEKLSEYNVDPDTGEAEKVE